jgi:hypothetical protein
MKKINVAILCLLCFSLPIVIGAASSGLYIAYPSTPWSKVRSAVAAADSGITTTTRTWSYFNTNLKDASYKVPAEASIISIMVAQSVSTATTAATLYACTDNGPLEKVCTFTTTSAIGAVRTSDSKFFACTFSITNDFWEKTSSLTPVPALTYEIEKLVINTRGRRYFYVYFTSISAGNADVYFMYQ